MKKKYVQAPGPLGTKLKPGDVRKPGKAIRPWRFRKIRITCPCCSRRFTKKVREESGVLSLVKAISGIAIGGMIADKLKLTVPGSQALVHLAGSALQGQVNRTLDIATGKRRIKRKP